MKHADNELMKIIHRVNSTLTNYYKCFHYLGIMDLILFDIKNLSYLKPPTSWDKGVIDMEK